ncbi:purine-cytosine permease family protein [Microcella flavibacter]|uniref:purine-cytosine permease family protein n=1 Tax=Microcella flavibacter TaxID=1804990 RepID=UPI00145710CD|nr:cytosine permease [Microcella flavibacter]
MIDDRPEESPGSAAPPGPRRSTFTPPPAGAEYRPGSLTDGEGAPPIAAPAPSPMPVDAMPSAASPSPASAPVSIPDPPRRASLTDEALLRVADPDAADADTAALIALVEQQLSLRVEEAERLQLWERAVRDAGVPDADELVQSVRSSFTGVIDLVPPRDAAPTVGDDPWAQYPGTVSPPPRSEEDREPANAPLVVRSEDAPAAPAVEAGVEADARPASPSPDTMLAPAAVGAAVPGPAGVDPLTPVTPSPAAPSASPASPAPAAGPAPDLLSALAEAPPPVVGTGVTVPSPVESAAAPEASGSGSSVPSMSPAPLPGSPAAPGAGSLAAAPPPYGLVPSAVAPPPADDDTADIPLVLPTSPWSVDPVPSSSAAPAPAAPTPSPADEGAPPSASPVSPTPEPVPLVEPIVEPVPTTTGLTDLERLFASIPPPTGETPLGRTDAPGSADDADGASASTSTSGGPGSSAPSAPLAPAHPLAPASTATAAPAPAGPPAPPVAPSTSSPSAPAVPVGSSAPAAAPAFAAAGRPDAAPPAPRTPAPGTAPIVPLPTAGPPRDPAPLRVEEAALEPTPAALRAGRSLRLFWLWFSVSASAVSIGLGGVLLGLGMSLRQAILSALIGVAVSFLPLGLGTLAGKWSGQPTIVVSRATFGVVGNAVPAALSVLTRLLWAAALLWMLGTGTASALAPLGVDPRLAAPLAALLGLLIAASIAGLGFGLIVRVAAVASVLAAVLLVALIALTAPRLDIPQALTIPDGGWVLVVTGAVLVFSVVGLAWAQSSGDLARYQSRSTLGVGAVMWTGFGATVPAFLLVCWGAMLAASDPRLAVGLARDPIGALAGVLSGPASLLLLLALALSLVLAAALALYSGGFALLTAGLRAARWTAVLVAAVVTGAVLAVLAATTPSLDALLRDGLTTLAVPVAAWAGVFGAETMLRRRRVHSPSLLRSGGVYPAVRTGNLVALLAATLIGWGLTGAETAGLGWQGYLWALVGADALLVASDLGVAVALVVGLLVPVVAGVPALRRLEAAERAAVDS